MNVGAVGEADLAPADDQVGVDDGRGVVHHVLAEELVGDAGGVGIDANHGGLRYVG